MVGYRQKADIRGNPHHEIGPNSAADLLLLMDDEHRQDDGEEIERSIDHRPCGVQWYRAVQSQLGDVHRPAGHPMTDEDVEGDERNEYEHGNGYRVRPGQ